MRDDGNGLPGLTFATRKVMNETGKLSWCLSKSRGIQQFFLQSIQNSLIEVQMQFGLK